MVAESVGSFDEVNVATALHRLAKLQPPNGGGGASPIVYADQFQQLVSSIRRQLHRFEAQAVSNTLWGKLAMCPVAVHRSLLAKFVCLGHQTHSCS